VHDAVQQGTPALVVRGSGKAADLLADASLLRFSEVTTNPHANTKSTNLRFEIHLGRVEFDPLAV